jgi:hypothetical protein
MHGVEVGQSHIIRIRRCGDLMMLTISGLYHYAVNKEARGLLRAELAKGAARAIVADLTAAVSLSTAAERKQAVRDSVYEPDPLVLPVAIVTSSTMLPAVTAQCEEAWRHGRQWVPFLRLSDALSWAGSRRLHWSRVPPHQPWLHSEPSQLH